jgi:Tol biopolymer transport system component
MTLPAGARLGPYQIVEPLGAGGMGEVYRARDGRLGRDVAVKVLPDTFGTDAERVLRFEQEARAVAALNHPNILSVFDIGEDDRTRYIVTELLEGETLRACLRGGPLPPRRVQEYARQIAAGLAAAHANGIVHRDLKPENIFISKDGRAKILDFGLAKQSAFAALSGAGATVTAVQTSPGVVLGTVAYMSPEQVRGSAVDHRSDIFSFGAVLYEMLAGDQPFRRETATETMTAILKDDPPDLAVTPERVISPAMERIVRHCLEKDPGLRFQSAHDLAFALDTISGTSALSSATAPLGTDRRTRTQITAATAAAALLVAVIAAGVVFLRRGGNAIPIFEQVTGSRGWVRLARFSPDGQNVVFGGAWNGDPMKLWFQRPGRGSGFSALQVPDADLLAVSPTGELAISLNQTYPNRNMPSGTLARTSFTGGAPRELLEGVLDADWSPDGADIAVARWVGSRFHLEYPVSKVVYATGGYVSDIRFSHRGDKIAFMDHPLYGDDRGVVCIVDRAGNRTVLTREWSSEQGLAWTTDDKEIWFTATDSQSGRLNVLRAVSLAGTDRVVLRAPGNLKLHDISATGAVLLSTDTSRYDISVGDMSGGRTADLTWFDFSWNQTLSHDNRWIAFSQDEAGSSENYSVYVRKTDGTPAIRLGDGDVLGFSPDNKWLASTLPVEPHVLQLLPLGPGALRTLKSQKVDFFQSGALWTPDSRSFAVVGTEPGHGARTYLQPVDGGEPNAITPEDVLGDAISPDGKQLLAHDLQGKFWIYPLIGGQPREVTSIGRGDSPVQWLTDGRTVIVRAAGRMSVTAYQVDLETGARRPWKEFTVKDNVALHGIYQFHVTPDGNHYLMVEMHMNSTMFIVHGLH